MKRAFQLLLIFSFFGNMDDAHSMSNDERVIQGIIAPRGINCPRIKLEDGRIASLMGVSPSLAPGTKLRLEGQWVKRSTCQQGPTFQATAVHIL
jgi:hypothetical protein